MTIDLPVNELSTPVGLCAVASATLEHGTMLVPATVIASTAAIGSCSKETSYICSCSTQLCYSSVPDHHYSVQSCTTETSGRTGDTGTGYNTPQHQGRRKRSTRLQDLKCVPTCMYHFLKNSFFCIYCFLDLLLW